MRVCLREREREILCYINCTHVEISQLTKHALAALPQCTAEEIHWPIHPDHPDATGNLVPCLSYCQHNERRHHSYAGQTKADSEGRRKGQGGTRDTVSTCLKWGNTKTKKEPVYSGSCRIKSRVRLSAPIGKRLTAVSLRVYSWGTSRRQRAILNLLRRLPSPSKEPYLRTATRVVYLS